MKKCNVCGADIDDNKIICPICGAAQLAMNTQNSASKDEGVRDHAESGMNQFQNNSSPFQNDPSKFQSNPFMTGNQMPGAMNPGAVDSFGNPIQSNFARPTQTYSYSPSSRNSGGLIRTILTLVIAAIVLVLVLVAYKKLSGPSIKKNVEMYYQAMGNLDGKAFVSAAFPEEVVDSLESKMNNIYMSKDEIYSFLMRYIMSAAGKSPTEKVMYKDFKISNTKFTKQSDLKEFSDELNSMFDSNIKITSARVFDVSYKYSKDGNTWLDGKDKAAAYKVDGKWYVFSDLFGRAK